MEIRDLVKKTFPRLVTLYRRNRASRKRAYFRTRSVAETFEEIYRKKEWGTLENEPFCSGHGSADRFTEQYVDTVAQFIARHGVKRVLDIGCGDFRVGRKLVASSDIAYVGVDIVQSVIEHDRATFGSPTVQFVCGNAIDDDLPDADLCLIRQVLQHLSNSQIASILGKCRRYRYVIVTEDVYVGPDARPNVDKPHGPDTRAAEKSGVFLELAPFGFDCETILEIADTQNATLRTIVIEMPL